MMFLSPLYARLRFFSSALLRPLWTWLFVGMLGIFGSAAFLRDEFLSSSEAAKWKLLVILPHWPLSYWLGVLAVVLLIVLFEGAYQAYAEIDGALKNKIDQLDRIAEDRPFDYSNSAWGITGNDFHKSFPTWALNRLDLVFENSSDRTLDYKFKELFVQYEHNKINIPVDPHASNYIHARKTMSYGFDISGLIIPKLPATVTTGYRVEYDNVSSVRKRGTKRFIEHTFKSFKPMIYTNKITEQDEYWPSETDDMVQKKAEESI